MKLRIPRYCDLADSTEAVVAVTLLGLLEY